MPASFQQELRAYPPPKASAARQLIDRWLDDERADEVWTRLQAARPDAEAASFIKTVIDARRSAQATVNRIFGATWYRGGQRTKIPGFNDEWAVVFPALRKELGSLSPHLGPLSVAAILEDAAQELRDLHRRHFGFADHARFELSRKDQRGSRVRRLFMQITGNYFFENFGRPFDNEVAILAGIAFPGGKELDRDDVINARHPTTARSRSKRKKRRSGTFKPKIRG
jgi:hypothetical protein